MTVMTPARYAERYLNLEVPFDDGPATVRIAKYHIGPPDAEQALLWQALKDYFRKNQQRQPGWTLRLRVNGEPVEFPTAQQMLHRVVNPFWGKGSPEDCQIVLQLAVLLRRVDSKAVLQQYCDAHLGLDCNGFVGNYLFRIHRGNGWRGDAPDGAAGPSDTITQIMSNAGGFVIHSVDQMVPSRMHVLAEVDIQNRIIPGGPSAVPGHIVMTEPGRYMNSFMSMNLDLAGSGALGAPAFWGTESTGGSGLVQSWYAVTQLMNGTRPVDGVFRVFRGVKRHFLNFRIIGLS